MRMSNEAEALKAIAGEAEYQAAFKKAYGREMNHEDLGRAIGAFKRTLVFLPEGFGGSLGGDRRTGRAAVLPAGGG